MPVPEKAAKFPILAPKLCERQCSRGYWQITDDAAHDGEKNLVPRASRPDGVKS
jgi:hypothetical protein